MKKYKVSFWFGTYNENTFINPNKVIYVETESVDENEIKLLALDKINEAYPRTYSALVQEDTA